MTKIKKRPKPYPGEVVGSQDFPGAVFHAVGVCGCGWRSDPQRGWPRPDGSVHDVAIKAHAQLLEHGSLAGHGLMKVINPYKLKAE